MPRELIPSSVIDRVSVRGFFPGLSQRFDSRAAKLSLPGESMIRRNYAEMMKGTQRVEFGVARAQGGSAILQVFFFADNGEARAFLYTFVVEDGVWKIEGVEPMPMLRSRQAGLHV